MLESFELKCREGVVRAQIMESAIKACSTLKWFFEEALLCVEV